MSAIGPRVDLAAIMRGDLVDDGERPTVLRRSDGVALLYPESVNLLCGAPGSGKTWVALLSVVEVAEAGLEAWMLDYESTAAKIAGRLGALGLSVEDVGHVHYHQVAGSFGDADRRRLRGELERSCPMLVVVDSTVESLTANGFDENAAGDVGRWFASEIRPVAQAGPAVLLLDHVTKNPDGRAGWARGSGHKLAAVDGAAYGLEVDVPWHRGGGGSAVLRILKDRGGHVGPAGSVAANVRVSVLDGGQRVFMNLDPPSGDDTAPPKGDKRMSAQDVADRLARSGGIWTSRDQAAQVLKLSGTATRAALDRALVAGLVVETRDGRSIGYRLPEPGRLDIELQGLIDGGGEGP